MTYKPAKREMTTQPWSVWSLYVYKYTYNLDNYTHNIVSTVFHVEHFDVLQRVAPGPPDD